MNSLTYETAGEVVNLLNNWVRNGHNLKDYFIQIVSSENSSYRRYIVFYDTVLDYKIN